MSLPFKVYDEDRNYIAATTDAMTAANVLSQLLEGSVIKYNGRIVYKEGEDGFAGASWDIVHEQVWARIGQHRKERQQRRARTTQSPKCNCGGAPHRSTCDTRV